MVLENKIKVTYMNIKSVFAICFFSIFQGFLLQGKVLESEVTVNVWVHGTNPPPETIIMHKYSPLRPWLYAESGLSLAINLPKNYYFHQLAYACSQSDSQEFNLDHFYIYGWPSTVLSPERRKEEGKKLFEQLNNLVNLYKQKFSVVKIRCIGFSHGGNVILNMIPYLPFSQVDTPIEIIFFAVPVQEETRSYINSKWIGLAWSFYSDNDWMQILDIQKFHKFKASTPWFSKKTFNDDDLVLQIKLTINGKAIGHRDYRSIQHHLPRMVKNIKMMIKNDQKIGYIDLDFVTI